MGEGRTAKAVAEGGLVLVTLYSEDGNIIQFSRWTGDRTAEIGTTIYDWVTEGKVTE